MKKLVVIVIVLALALSIVACGGNGGGQQSPGNSPSANSPASSNSPGAAAPASPSAPEAKEGMSRDVLKGATGEIVRYTTEAPSKYAKADPTTLFVGQMVVVENGNPGFGSDSPFYRLVYDPFVTFDYNTGEYVGCVIKDWKLADDGLSMTFTLQEGIKFHDGTTATMDDFLYSLWRFSQPELARLADRTVFGNIDYDNTEKIDDYHGKIAFTVPIPHIISGLTRAYLFSKTHIETAGEDNAWWNNCVGSGPYTVDSIVQGDRYNLVKADSYWGADKGSFEKVVIRYYAEASTMYIDYETGILDIIINPLAVDVSRVINGEVTNTICDIYPMLFLAYMGFNEEMNPALMDINVRKAVCLSIDPAMVSKMVLDFLGTPATALSTEGVGGRYVTEFKQDIEGAKKALADAGYKPGELKLTIGTSTNNVNMNVAEAVQAQIAEVGIVVEIISAEPSVNLNNLRNQGPDTYDLAQGFFQYVTLEPNAMLMTASKKAGSTSFGSVTDDAAEEIAMRALSALTVAEKEAAISELQKYLCDNYWFAPLFEQKVAIIYRDYITGIRVIAPRECNLNAVSLVG